MYYHYEKNIIHFLTHFNIIWHFQNTLCLLQKKCGMGNPNVKGTTVSVCLLSCTLEHIFTHTHVDRELKSEIHSPLFPTEGSIYRIAHLSCLKLLAMNSVQSGILM